MAHSYFAAILLAVWISESVLLYFIGDKMAQIVSTVKIVFRFTSIQFI